jgi:uncharacterized membrane protein
MGRNALADVKKRGAVQDFKDILARSRKRSAEGRAKRFWELDAIRGCLVILMAAYHSFYTANYIGLSLIDPFSGIIGISPIFIASGFLLVSGAALRIQAMRLEASGAPKRVAPFLRRALAIGLAALAVTVVTFIAVRAEYFVAFGVLHCIALSGIIAIPLLKRPRLALVLGVLAAVPGFIFLKDAGFDPSWSKWLFWLGFRPANYFPVDFVPLLPWAGMVFIGVFVGSLFFDEKGKRRYAWNFPGTGWVSRALCFIGRHSLFIYVVHIPIIMGILLGIQALLGILG